MMRKTLRTIKNETMRYFKNGSRITAITEDGHFLQFKEGSKLTVLTIGQNRFIIEDVYSYDLEITDQEFSAVFSMYYHKVDEFFKKILMNK